jgi:hypothetical protein
MNAETWRTQRMHRKNAAEWLMWIVLWPVAKVWVFFSRD